MHEVWDIVIGLKELSSVPESGFRVDFAASFGPRQRFEKRARVMERLRSMLQTAGGSCPLEPLTTARCPVLGLKKKGLPPLFFPVEVTA
jgi:hypothetical protein